jgi:RNA polymerase sigma factor (sigma-70 family)
MNKTDTVLLWLDELKQGNREPVRMMLERYLHRLVAIAEKRFNRLPHLAGYGEDVALSALKSLCLGVEKGKFQKLRGSDDLLRLLCVMTTRKSIDLQRKKWADANVADEVVIMDVLSREPSPDEANAMIDGVNALLKNLGDDELKQIAEWKVAGWTNQEIAKKIGCVERSVERKLQRIRLLWEAEWNAL